MALQTAGILHPARLFRRAFGGIVGEGVAVYNNNGDLKVTAVGGNMQVSISSGAVWIKGTDITDQGNYFCYNGAAVVLTLNNSDPTNDRIDLIVAHVKDNTEGQAGDTWVLEKVTGTPSGSPSPPAKPASSYVLAQVRVNAGVSSVSNANITDKRKVVGLVVSSGLPTVRVNKSGSPQNLPDSSDTAITWDTVEYDWTTPFYSGGSPNRLTVPAGLGGIYIITVNVYLTNFAGGERRNIKIWRNGIGGDMVGENQLSMPAGTFSANYGIVLPLTEHYLLNDNDYVQISAFQDKGSTGTNMISNAVGLTHFSLARIQ
jgi:hypothetical protein